MKSGKPERIVFWTTNGLEVPVKAVPEIILRAPARKLEHDYRERGEPINKPTYTVVTAGGGTETHEHDEASLEVRPPSDLPAGPEGEQILADIPRRTEENRKAWEAYKEARGRLEAEQSKASARILIEEGLDLQLPADDAWVRRQMRHGVEVPDDPDERRYHWLTSEVLVSPQDLMNAIQAVTAASYQGAVREEDIEAMMSTFRTRMERAAIQLIPGVRLRSAVALQRAAGGDAGGPGLGQEPERVPEPAIPGPGGDGGDGTGPEPDGDEGAGRG